MPGKEAVSQQFLDQNQYTKKSILRYERIFGHTWVSTGGETTTRDFLTRINLKPGHKVLDVGCGTGGSAFFIARQFAAKVHGVDLSSNMIDIANDRLEREENIIKERVTFEIADIMKANYEPKSFDLIYSRDTILHIVNKEKLYKDLLKLLKPGGVLLVTDYCRGDQEHSKDFIEYVKKRDYDLRTVKAYGKVLENAGYDNVQAIDSTNVFLEVLNRELKFFQATKEAFIKDFAEEDYKEICNGWQAKTRRCGAGDQAWGLFIAYRPT